MRDAEITRHRKRRTQPPVIRHPANAPARDFVRRAMRYLAAIESDRAAPRTGQSENRTQHRGLAGTVGAKQCKYLSALHRERRAEQRLCFAVERIDRLDFQNHANRPRLERLTHSFCCSSCGAPRATT